MNLTYGKRSQKTRRRLVASILAASSTALMISAAGGGCAGAVYQDPPELSGGADASTDAPTDASSDAPTDAPPLYSGPIGDPCASNADCGDGYRCQLTVPGGYCVMDCSPGMTCPQGTLCSPVPLSRVAGVCMRACASQADCRPAYECAVVALFPGDPSAPTSPGPVCWEPWPTDAGP